MHALSVSRLLSRTRMLLGVWPQSTTELGGRSWTRLVSRLIHFCIAVSFKTANSCKFSFDIPLRGGKAHYSFTKMKFQHRFIKCFVPRQNRQALSDMQAKTVTHNYNLTTILHCSTKSGLSHLRLEYHVNRFHAS